MGHHPIEVCHSGALCELSLLIGDCAAEKVSRIALLGMALFFTENLRLKLFLELFCLSLLVSDLVDVLTLLALQFYDQLVALIPLHLNFLQLILRLFLIELHCRIHLGNFLLKVLVSLTLPVKLHVHILLVAVVFEHLEVDFLSEG